MAFSFEKLDVYQQALKWVLVSEEILSNIKGKKTFSLAEQLSRASLSVALNIAEGNGRWHKAEKRQFFWIARGSVFECVPILQVLKANGLLDEGKYNDSYLLLEKISKMLTGLIKSVEGLKKDYA